MTMTAIRKDWTPLEKRYLEDVALTYIRQRQIPWSEAKKDFYAWLKRRDPLLYRYADTIWSYVVTNWQEEEDIL